MRVRYFGRKGWTTAFIAAVACAAGPAAAQEEKLETIVVTGSRISYRDLLETPAVSITRPGDYLLLSLTLVSDTRNKESRENEIHETIRKMQASAGKSFQLVYGDTFLSTIDSKNYQIPLDDDDKRPDVSKVTIFVRTAIGGKPEKAEELTRELRDFVGKAERMGRTEIDVASETALSLTRPERFRYELVTAIAEDTARIRGQLGAGCEVSIEGLSSRIEWQRVSASELMLYIPYTMAIEHCGTGKPG
ncbi:hypothetical protein [Tahibacter amnicola]|uniref:SIMPL domain-containing protein n=1 Tax=Tahibacter amnicola TaxID=2976241 RepID=A0ABY6BKP4_9GAMM|nr:hypothetical protein [Tahibacter amnicola]UXI68950.1 hypothetical protein N4264_04655 [Tahibacter amnicola]